MKQTILITIMMLLLVVFSFGQDNTDFGLWGEVQVNKSLTKDIDLLFGGRLETKQDTSKFQEQRVFAGFSFKKGNWTIQPTYIYVNFSARTTTYQEHRPSLLVTRKFTIGKKWTVTPGIRNEFRIRPGKNDYRAVPLVTVERKLNNTYKLYGTYEFWMDTRKHDVTQYRNRVIGGVNRKINNNLSIDVFYVYTRDAKTFPEHQHRIGTRFRFKL